MKELQLNKTLAIEDLNLWIADTPDGLTFRVTKTSGFSLFAEGVAIARLHEISSANVPVRVLTTFEIAFSTEGNLETLELGALYGLFGVALVDEALSVVDAAGRDVKMNLRGALWRIARSGRGRFGDGRKQNVVSRDPDSPIPEVLLRTSRTQFPYLEDFRNLMTAAGRELGGGDA